MRLCKALKETHNTLKQLTDQTESEEATLHANIPSKKRSLAFVRAVLTYNVSPQKIDEMISNLKQMQTEIQDRLRNLVTSFNDVYIAYDFSHRQLMRTPTSASTSTTLPARLQLANWLETFGGRGSSKRSRSETVSSLNQFRVLILILVLFELQLQTFFHTDPDEDEPHTAPLPQASWERLLDAEMNPAPPSLPPRPVLNTVPLNPGAEAAQRRIPSQHPKSDTATGGRNVNHYFVPPKGAQTSSDARKPSTSIHSQLHVPMRPPVPTRPPPNPPQSDWAKKQQPFMVKRHEWQTQVATRKGVLNRTPNAKDNEESQKAMEEYYSRQAITAPSPSSSSTGTTPQPPSTPQVSPKSSQPLSLANAVPRGNCPECDKPISGPFVRAPGGVFHVQCFTCLVSTSRLPRLIAR